jgi:hypothetical protein
LTECPGAEENAKCKVKNVKYQKGNAKREITGGENDEK